MYCKNCGNVLNPNSSFCTNCGAKIENEIQNNQTNINNNVTPKKKKPYWLIPVLVFVAMMLSQTIKILLTIMQIEMPFISSLLGIIYIVCGFAILPSIIVAIVLSVKNNGGK